MWCGFQLGTVECLKALGPIGSSSNGRHLSHFQVSSLQPLDRHILFKHFAKENKDQMELYQKGEHYSSWLFQTNAAQVDPLNP